MFRRAIGIALAPKRMKPSERGQTILFPALTGEVEPRDISSVATPVSDVKTPGGAGFSGKQVALQTAKEAADASKMLRDLPPGLHLPTMEEDVGRYWSRIDAFKTSLKQSEGKKEFTFYDGPPFATGMPHYGHILAGTIKDVMTRYAHQTGHHVVRRFGWDCHGLPIEFEIEKEHGIKSSHDVKAMGIDKYNEACRGIVMRYAKEWEHTIGRTGRWIDFKNDYKTMDLSYMESVWWVFKQLWEKDLVYRGFKVMPYSTGCTTPLSNFEANMNYKDVSDPSVTVSFPIVGSEDTSFLAWTTTPWTLPSNLALCVHPTMEYVKVLETTTGKKFIVAAARLDDIFGLDTASKKSSGGGKKQAKKTKESESDAAPKVEVLERMTGADLVGLQYEPLFNYFAERRDTAFRIIADDYVTSDAGTGVVHNAPGFGEDDFRVCLSNGVLQKGDTVCPVDENGCFTADVTDFTGQYIKECDAPIAELLKKQGRLFKKNAIVHKYPFCWRSDKPLIYKAVDAWFVRVEDLRERLLENNAKTKWVPDFVKSKRFSNWLEDARDWNVSRNRYWGTPLPVWVSEDLEEIVCVGSVAELEQLSGVCGLTDLHRDTVDSITIPSKREGKPPLKRIEQVFDCWFESGSMPYAQAHYPFENADTFKTGFPADFIAEGLDQTRGWFYTLLVLSTALFNQPPYKNLIVNGLVLAEDGAKMSKRLKNYPEVSHVINEHGADALRLYLINSPLVRAEPLRFREAGVKDVVKEVMLPLLNSVKFFVANSNLYLSGGRHTDAPLCASIVSDNVMDRWIIAASQSLVRRVREEMQEYRLFTVVPSVVKFVDLLTNWYVRMNRRRLKGADGDDADWRRALSTLYRVLDVTSVVLAPYTPFVAEQLYHSIRELAPEADRHDSVHYRMIPEVTSETDVALETTMAAMIKVINFIRVVRDRVKISMKKPLRHVTVCIPDSAMAESLKEVSHYISSEANVLSLELSSDEEAFLTVALDANMAVLGKRLGKTASKVRAEITKLGRDDIVTLRQGGEVSVTVDGKAIPLTMDDVKITRQVNDRVKGFETGGDNELTVLIDAAMDETTQARWRAREFVYCVQMLRKASGLQVSDIVDVYYWSPDDHFVTDVESCRDVVSETIKGRWVAAEPPAGAEMLVIHSNSIAGAEINIAFVKPQV